MNTNLVRQFVTSPPTKQAPTLRDVLEELDITPFTPDSVAQYKRKKMAAVMEEIVQRRKLMQEIAPAKCSAGCGRTTRSTTRLTTTPS
jgi:hypothetical protein